MGFKKRLLICFIFLLYSITLASAQTVQPLPYQEDFEDTNFASRGWYDNTGMTITSSESHSGNSALQVTFNQGSSTPTYGGGVRLLFTNSDSIYLSYWVKYSSNWQGSGQNTQPHEFHFMTTENTQWKGPAHSKLTTYVEHNWQNTGRPRIAIQDGMNINPTNAGPGQPVLNSENRAIAGCNGIAESHATEDCYNDGQWRNGKYWVASSGLIQPNQWHYVEAYFKLNSIQGGIGQPDGIVQYWLDGNLIFNYNDVYLRTGTYPNMEFNQFLIAPYIGAGSPVTQTMWIDDLTIATSRTGTPPPPTNNPGDLNNDNIVDIMDIMIIVPDIGKTSGYDARADVNGDGIINVFDLVNVAKHWGANYGGGPPTPPPTPPPPPPPPPLPSGLVLAYGFDEGTGALTTDSSVNGNTGTIVSGSWTTGKYLNAISFDGSTTWVDAGSPTATDDLTPQTITMWVNPNTLTGYLISKRDTCAGAWRLEASLSWFKIFTGTDATTTASSTLPTNTWTHLALTWDGTTNPAKIYLNGIETGYTTQTTGSGTASSDATCDLRIGSRQGTSAFYNGIIDEVRIYNRVLSPNEITTDMNTPTNTQPPPPPTDNTPPTITNTGPNGARISGTTTLTMTATTDEPATCGWSTSNVIYSSMTPFFSTGGTTHTHDIIGLQDGQSYTRYIRCQDIAGNPNTASVQIDFNILTPGTPPPPPPTGVDLYLDFNDPNNLGVTCAGRTPNPVDCDLLGAGYRKHSYVPSGGVNGSGAINMHWFTGMPIGFSPVWVGPVPHSRHFKLRYAVKQTAPMVQAGSSVKLQRIRSDNTLVGTLVSKQEGNMLLSWEAWIRGAPVSPTSLGIKPPSDNQWHIYEYEIDYRNPNNLVFTFWLDGQLVTSFSRASNSGDVMAGHTTLTFSPFAEMYSCGDSGPCSAGINTGDFTVDDFTYTVLP